MNRGFEIIRRLLLTIVWGITLVFTFGLPIASCNDKLVDRPSWIAIEDKDDYNAVADYAKSRSEDDPEYANAMDQLRGYVRWKERREEGWWLVAAGLIFPPIGFGLHRLINWILVHKPTN